jgi:hypothetical protein
MIGSWMKMLLAILLGNVVYFRLMPYLPDILAHKTYRVDTGLIFDMAICATIYVLVRKIV